MPSSAGGGGGDGSPEAARYRSLVEETGEPLRRLGIGASTSSRQTYRRTRSWRQRREQSSPLAPCSMRQATGDFRYNSCRSCHST
jgi:hypothetical protein